MSNETIEHLRELPTERLEWLVDNANGIVCDRLHQRKLLDAEIEWWQSKVALREQVLAERTALDAARTQGGDRGDG